MIVESPAPGVAAAWHATLNRAAAKLAVAAGIAPSEVQRVSGLTRVEVRRSRTALIRQIAELSKAAALTAESVPQDLTDPSAADRILRREPHDDIGVRFLHVCERARHYERLHKYFDKTEEFNQEHGAIMSEFYRCQSRVAEIDAEYCSAGETLQDIARQLTPKTSLAIRRQFGAEVDSLVARRDHLRMQMTRIRRETGEVMYQLRRHYARRCYYHSRNVPEYRDPAQLFVPAKTLAKEEVCEFEKTPPPEEMREKCLRLMREWDDYCSQFVVINRTITLEHKQDEMQDHGFRAALA